MLNNTLTVYAPFIEYLKEQCPTITVTYQNHGYSVRVFMYRIDLDSFAVICRPPEDWHDMKVFIMWQLYLMTDEEMLKEFWAD